MALDRLQLQVVLDMADRASAPLKKLGLAAFDITGKFARAEESLKKLQSKQEAIARFRGLQERLKETGASLESARQKMEQARAEFEYGGPQIKALGDKYVKAKQEVDNLTAGHQRLTEQTVQMRTALNNAGVGKLSSAEANLAGRIKDVNAQLDRQRPKLEAIKRLNEGHAKSMMRIAGITAGGYGVFHAGSRFFGEFMGEGIGQAKAAELEETRIKLLGRPDAEIRPAIEAVKHLHIAGTTTAENVGMLGDSLSVFTHVDEALKAVPMLAKVLAANKVNFNEGKDGEHTRLLLDMLKVGEGRGGGQDFASLMEQTDWIQKAINASRGRIDAEQFRQMLQRGGVAAQSMSHEAFYSMEAVIQHMGSGSTVGNGLMSGYQNLIQGKTTKGAVQNLEALGLIGDRSKVDHDKAGQIAHIHAGALKGASLFQKDPLIWVRDVLLPTLKARGITTPEQIKQAIGGIFSNRAASNLFVQMATQIDQFMAARERLEHAMDVDETHKTAMNSTKGKELEMETQRANALQGIGEAVKPIYTSLLETVTALLVKVNAFIQAHPGITNFLVLFASLIAGVVTAVGGLAMMLGPWMLASFIIKRFAISFLSVGPAVSKTISVLGKIGPALRGVWAVLAANPVMVIIALIIAALLVAGYFIYKHWDQIKAWLARTWSLIVAKAKAAWHGFLNFWNALGESIGQAWETVWNTVKTFAEGVWTGIKQAAWTFVDQAVLAPIDWVLQKLANVPFMSAGANMMRGLIQGIRDSKQDVQAAAGEVAAASQQGVKQPLQIQSPSRVFMGLGQFIGEGLALGIERGRPLASRAALALAAAAVAPVGMAGAMPALQSPSASAARSGAGGARPGASTYAITINAQPGMDPQAIAQAVRQELDRRERANRSRVISQMADTE